MYTVNLGQAVNKPPAQSSTLTPDFSPATTPLIATPLFIQQAGQTQQHASLRSDLNTKVAHSNKTISIGIRGTISNSRQISGINQEGKQPKSTNISAQPPTSPVHKNIYISCIY